MSNDERFPDGSSVRFSLTRFLWIAVRSNDVWLGPQYVVSKGPRYFRSKDAAISALVACGEGPAAAVVDFDPIAMGM